MVAGCEVGTGMGEVLGCIKHSYVDRTVRCVGWGGGGIAVCAGGAYLSGSVKLVFRMSIFPLGESLKQRISQTRERREGGVWGGGTATIL